MKKSQLNKLRNIFLVIFILSGLLSLGIPIKANSGGTPDNSSAIIAIYISMFTSVTAFLGFLVTAILSFRRDRREALDAELSQKQKEIELERARLELEQLKKQVNKKKK